MPAQVPLRMALSGVGVAYALNPAVRAPGRMQITSARAYAIPELTEIAAVLEGKYVRFGLARLGFEGYHESTLDVAARLPGVAGLRLRVRHARLPGFRAQASLRPELGVVRPPFGVVLSPSGFAFGGVYEVPPWTFLADISTDRGHLDGGVAWLYRVSAVTLLGSTGINPERLGLGMLLQTGPLLLAIAVNRHVELGWSQAVGVAWR